MGQLVKKVGPERISDVGAVVYTVPDSRTAYIVSASVINTSANDVIVNFNLYATGGSATDSNKVIHSQSVPANTTVDLYTLLNKTLESQDELYAIADTADSVNVSLGIIERF